MANEHGIILKTNVLPQAINHTLMTPDVHFRQNPNGSFTAGEIFSDEIDPNVDPMDLAVEVLKRIQIKLCDVPKLSLAEVMWECALCRWTGFQSLVRFQT